MAKKTENELNSAETIFCYEYIANKFNGTLAYLNAYPKTKTKKTASVMASKLLAKANINNKIKELTEKHLKTLSYTAEDVLKELAIMGFSKMSDYFNEDKTMKSFEEIGDPERAIQSVEIVEIGDSGKKIKFKLHDKKGSLELLGKNMQLFIDRVDHTTNGESLNLPNIYLPDNGRNK